MDLLYTLIGHDADTITWWQMSVRAVLVFLYALLLLRLAGKRLYGKSTTFDIVLSVIIGSILSRALTGNARFLPTFAAAGTLVGVYWLMGRVARRWPRFGHAIKGHETRLVADGAICRDALAKSNMTEHDLYEALRINGSLESTEGVKAAYLERSGDVSVIKQS